MANELTAVLGGLLGYVGVIAALGVLVMAILEADGVATGMNSGPRSDWAAVARPDGASTVSSDRIAGPDRPELRRSVAAK